MTELTTRHLAWVEEMNRRAIVTTSHPKVYVARATSRRFTPLTLLAFSLLVGCAVRGQLATVSPNAKNLGGDLTNIQKGAADGSKNLQDAKNSFPVDTPDAVKVPVDAAANDLTGITGNANDAQAQLVILNKQYLVASQHANDYDAYLKDHYNDWLGPRAHRLAWYLLILIIVVSIGVIALFAANAMDGGALAGITNILGHIFTGGLQFIGTWIGEFVGWILTELGKLGGKAATVVAKASPNPPATTTIPITPAPGATA